jgi:Na+-driven multidrug efflux pump
MHDTQPSRSSKLDINSASTDGRGHRFTREIAEGAADEVAEATDPEALIGMVVEPAVEARLAATEDAELSGEERREVSRQVFRLAWPAIAENALQTLLGIVDTAIVARLGNAALSGVGAAQLVVWVLSTAIIAISMGTTVLIARFTGAGDRPAANTVLKQSILLGTLAGLLMSFLAFLSDPMMAVLGLTPEAVRDGSTYLGITLAFSILFVLMFVAGAALRGAGDTKTPMLVTAFINVINALLALLLVFGGVKAGAALSDWLSAVAGWIIPGARIDIPGLSWIPELGVAGAAWATVIARGIGTAILLGVFLHRNSRLHLWTRGGWLPNPDIVKRVLRVGIPSAVEQMFMSFGILIYSFLVIGMGEVIFATSRLALNAVFLSQMPGFGFSMAATTLVGQSLGAKQPRRADLGSRLATRSALIWMSAMGLAFFFFGEPILRIFTDDPELLRIGGEALKVIAFSQPPLALAFVLGGSLRGAGDVRYPMWVTTIAVWIVRIPTGAFMGLNEVCIPFTNLCLPGLGWGLVGIYAALIVESAFRAVLFYRRYREGKWQTMKV